MSYFNDLYYTAALVEYIGRESCNRRKTVAEAIGVDGIRDLMDTADVNHCLSFSQVADEVTEAFGIQRGTYDTVSMCEFKVPSHLAIGKVYARLVEDTEQNPEQYANQLYEVLTSELSDVISDFNCSMFFAPRAEIAYNYRLLKAG